MPGPRLTLAEREFIAAARRDDVSRRAIAKELGRAPSTISRELRRNRPCNFGYRPSIAHGMARTRAKRPKVFKLERHRQLRRWVLRLLRKNWSPEQISARLRKEHPDDPRWWVSPEAIYKALYVQGRGELREVLHRHLRTGRTQRKTGGETRGRLAQTVHISERPAEARDRAVPGHWEGDLLLGKAGRSQVGMLTERATRFTMLFKLEDRKAATVSTAMAAKINQLPVEMRRSLALDNGKEFAGHLHLAMDTGLRVFFCDPAKPWQRGTAENTIGLLRQYMPKNADLSLLTQAQLDAVAAELNDRPRKTLDWLKPVEAYSELVGVATAE